MKLQHQQEVTVGFLVILAIAIFVGGFAWLAGRPLLGGRQVSVQIRFVDVRGLSVGDPVLTSGLQVGRVSDVRLEDVGRVMVVLQLDTDTWRPRIDARAEVKSLDFLGTKFVDYDPGNAEQLLTAEQVVTGTRETDALEGASGLADQAASVLTGLQSFLDPTLADEFLATMQAAREALGVVTEFGGGSLIADATGALQSARRAVGRIDSILANPAIEESVNQLDEVTMSLQEMADGLAGATTALGSILEQMNSGDGSIGLMLRDSALYNNTNDVLVSLRELLDDMRERPGRYFRLNVF